MSQDAQLLLKLQEIQSSLLKIDAALENIPEKKRFNDLKAKFNEVMKNRRQLVGELKDMRMEHEQVFADHKELEEKREVLRTQPTASDFRNSKQYDQALSNMGKQLNKYEHHMDKLGERLRQHETALEKLDEVCETLKQAQEASKTKCVQAITQLAHQKQELIGYQERIMQAIDPDLLVRFQEKCKKYAGRGVAKLSDGRCSVCKHEFMEGQLFRIAEQAQEAIAECPSCHRLLIVEND